MKKPTTKTEEMTEEPDMRAEYDFTSGVRGKHFKAMQEGYTITIHHPDGMTTRKEVQPKEGTVVLEPDLLEYFPDSQAVNAALRTLVSLIPIKQKAKRRRKLST